MINFRKAKMTDVESIHALINNFAEVGLMLARSRNTIYENLREFTIIEADNTLIGVGGLHIIWEDLAEIRALALHSDYHGQGIGKQLIERLIVEARELEIHRVFALTYQVEFFKKCGFREITKEEMPHKVWKECINCPKFPNCDEVAVIKELSSLT